MKGLRQEDCFKFKASLGYIVSSGQSESNKITSKHKPQQNTYTQSKPNKWGLEMA